MSTLLFPVPRAISGGFASDWADRILVAADARPSSDAAIAVAWSLGDHSPLDIISVLTASARGMIPEAARTARAEAIEAQLARVLGTVPNRQITVECGSPPDVIANLARLRGATLLIIGLGAAPVPNRALCEGLPLAIARRAHTPLLAVAAGHVTRPERIVVGIDFSAPSYSACDAAIEIAGPDSLIVLTHVDDANTPATASTELADLADRTQAGFSGRVMTETRQGDPTSELLDVARRIGADTIAIGGHGQAATRCTALGPVATQVMRSSPWSVLLVPAFDEFR